MWRSWCWMVKHWQSWTDALSQCLYIFNYYGILHFLLFLVNAAFIKFRLPDLCNNSQMRFNLIWSIFVAVSVIVRNLSSKLLSTKRQLRQWPNPQTQMWFLVQNNTLNVVVIFVQTHKQEQFQELHTFSSKGLTKNKSFPAHHYAAGGKHHHDWGLEYTNTYKHRLFESTICFMRAQHGPYNHIKPIT